MIFIYWGRKELGVKDGPQGRSCVDLLQWNFHVWIHSYSSIPPSSYSNLVIPQDPTGFCTSQIGKLSWVLEGMTTSVYFRSLMVALISGIPLGMWVLPLVCPPAFLASPQGKWDLSPPTNIEYVSPVLEALSLNHWTTREVPSGVSVS